MSAFSVSDLLISKTNHQGLVEGQRYRVLAVNTQRTCFGSFCSYVVSPLVQPEQKLEIVNAHLLMTKDEPHTGPCGSGWTGDRCTKKLGHKGRHSNE